MWIRVEHVKPVWQPVRQPSACRKDDYVLGPCDCPQEVLGGRGMGWLGSAQAIPSGINSLKTVPVFIVRVVFSCESKPNGYGDPLVAFTKNEASSPHERACVCPARYSSQR